MAFTWVRGYIADTNYGGGGGYIFGSATNGWTLERLRINIQFSGRTTPSSTYTDQPWRGQGLNFGIVEEYGGGVSSDPEYVYDERNSTDWLWWEHVLIRYNTVSVVTYPDSSTTHRSTFCGPLDGVRDLKAKRFLGGTTPHMALHWGTHNTGAGGADYVMTMGYSALYSH